MTCDFHKGNPQISTLIIYTRAAVSILVCDTWVSMQIVVYSTLMSKKKIFSWSGDDVSKVTPIYSVLATSIQFVIWCSDTLGVNTWMEKCHFT